VSLSDRELADLAREGDPEAFRRLMERHGPALTALLRGKVEQDDEEDLLQEVYLAAWRQMPRLRGAPWPWLRRIALNRASDLWRRRYRERRVLAGPEPAAAEAAPDPAPTPAEAAASSADLVRLEQALAGLRENLRLVVYLHLWEELPMAEVAARLNLREAAARMRLHRGLKQLRHRLEASGFQGLEALRFREPPDDT